MPQNKTTAQNIYILKKIFGDELRTHNISTNRVKCVTVLSLLYLMKPPVLDVPTLSASTYDADDFGFASVDEVECQQIIDELVRLSFVEKIGLTAYALSDRVRGVCDNSRVEFEHGQP